MKEQTALPVSRRPLTPAHRIGRAALEREPFDLLGGKDRQLPKRVLPDPTEHRPALRSADLDSRRHPSLACGCHTRFSPDLDGLTSYAATGATFPGASPGRWSVGRTPHPARSEWPNDK